MINPAVNDAKILAALAAMTPDPDGMITASGTELGVATGLHLNTVDRVRRRLIEAGRIEYVPGHGHGVRSRWRVLPEATPPGAPDAAGSPR
jgi:hypothetical protein